MSTSRPPTPSPSGVTGPDPGCRGGRRTKEEDCRPRKGEVGGDTRGSGSSKFSVWF